MNCNKIVSLLYEKPFSNNDAFTNPSVSWIEGSFGSNHNVTYIMRGKCDNDNVISFPDVSSTINTIKKLIFDSKFRSDFKYIRKLTLDEMQNADIIWVRGPSLFPILFSCFWRNDIRRKLFFHVCANRLTFDRLINNFKFKDIPKFIYGLVLKLLFFFLSRHKVTFFHTGSHVASNFSIKNSNYLIDFLVNEDAIQDSYNGKGMVCLGRMSKVNKNSELLRFLDVTNQDIDVFGPGDFIDNPKFIYRGIIDSKDVIYELKKYKFVVCLTDEYYEGFPRVIAEAVTLGMFVIISKKSTFINDILEYPKVIFSEDIHNKLDLEKKLDEISFANNDLNEFVNNVKKRSIAKISF